MYWLCKVYKEIINNSLPFRSIFYAINTLTYNISKFLVPILKSFTGSRYIVTHFFCRRRFWTRFGFFMGSLQSLTKIVRVTPLHLYSMLVANFHACFWSSLLGMASSGLTQHWARGKRRFWVTLSNCNMFLWTFYKNIVSVKFLSLIVAKLVNLCEKNNIL